MKKQIEANKKMLDKINSEGGVHLLNKNKLFDGNIVNQTKKNMEFGGACSSMVSKKILIIFYLFNIIYWLDNSLHSNISLKYIIYLQIKIVLYTQLYKIRF